LIKHE